MMPLMPDAALSAVVKLVLKGAKKATYYYSPKMVAKATYHGKRRRGTRCHTIALTVGAPNFAERKFIKVARKAGEPFPIKKIQIKS